MRPAVKNIIFFGALGVGAYLIYKNFFGVAEAAPATPAPGLPTVTGDPYFTPTSLSPGAIPSTGTPSNVYIPGGPFNGVPQTSIPGLSTPLAPGQTATVSVTQEDIYTEFPRLPTKAAAWDCKKLKEMTKSYTGISKDGGKKAETRARAAKMASYLQLVSNQRPC